jgi:hypothetical protein
VPARDGRIRRRWRLRVAFDVCLARKRVGIDFIRLVIQCCEIEVGLPKQHLARPAQDGLHWPYEVLEKLAARVKRPVHLLVYAISEQ